jgi:hypothetical protein
MRTSNCGANETGWIIVHFNREHHMPAACLLRLFFGTGPSQDRQNNGAVQKENNSSTGQNQ